MTGYNHYSNCTCGWCVNHGRSPVDRGALVREMRERDAWSFLKRNSALSVAGCYLNPNARCPVCGTPVFFYSNQFGSKVYFDDLGPPWPKHPCTDTPKNPIDGREILGIAPSRRARGLTLELVSAARTAGLLRIKTSIGEASEWLLLAVVDIDRIGAKNIVFAEVLAAERGATLKFSYFSDEPLFEVGDFVAKRGEEFSFFHRDSLSTVTFNDGSRVRPTPVIPPTQTPTTEGPPAVVTVRVGTSSSPRPQPQRLSKYDMTAAETKHYHSRTISVAELCRMLEPIVKTYARAGVRKPRDVAVRLNADGYRTANGSPWTPRLTHFLLGLIFNEATPDGKSTDPHLTELKIQPHGERLRSAGETSPLTQAEMASRLSALGRIVVKQK